MMYSRHGINMHPPGVLTLPDGFVKKYAYEIPAQLAFYRTSNRFIQCAVERSASLVLDANPMALSLFRDNASSSCPLR